MNERTKKRTLAIFILVSFVCAFAYYMPSLRYTFYDQMKSAFMLTDTQMGLVASAKALANTVCYPISGYFASKFSTKKLFIVSLIGFLVLTAWYWLAHTYVEVMIIFAMHSFFAIATFWSAYLNAVRALGTEENQGKMFGSSEATRGIAQTIAGFICLWIVGLVGNSLFTGFRGALFFCMIAYVLLLVATIFIMPDEDPVKAEAKKEKSGLKGFMEAVKDPAIWVVTFVVMCAYVSWTVGNGYMTTYTVRVLNISQQTASTIGIVRSYIIVLVAGFLGGYVVDKFSYKGQAFIVLFTLVAGLTAGVIFTSFNVTLCVIITLVLALIVNIMKSTYWSTMGQAGISIEKTAMATGVISFIAFIPDFFVGPICGSWLDAAEATGNVAVGFNKIFVFLIVFSVLGIVSAVILLKRTKSAEKSVKNTI